MAGGVLISSRDYWATLSMGDPIAGAPPRNPVDLVRFEVGCRSIGSPVNRARPYSGVPHRRFPFEGERVPLDLRFRGPLEAKSFVRGPKIDPPGALGMVFNLK